MSEGGAVLPGLDRAVSVATLSDRVLCGICRGPVPVPARRHGSPRKHCSDACRRIAWERAHPGKRGWQAALPGESRVERAFASWIGSEDGRVVEAEVIRRAMLLRSRGIQRWGIASLWEAIRYDSTLALHGEAGAWKLNNSFRAHLARKVMADVPQLGGFFSCRDLRGVR